MAPSRYVFFEDCDCHGYLTWTTKDTPPSPNEYLTPLEVRLKSVYAVCQRANKFYSERMGIFCQIPEQLATILRGDCCLDVEPKRWRGLESKLQQNWEGLILIVKNE
ncbi:hypothetical protein AVEN_83950-1 [Araneus ventricosus]|uniref:Uncharacterized protein n=1 Tax=Araneus ventricosus TaxID=182803 RepID=A0A4Y2BTL1_ARAVE|nr:hypothetical protein AVEN_83950-1 [Araneus ventricosus]